MELFEVTSDDDAELSITVRGYGPQDAINRARHIYCLVGVLHARKISESEEYAHLRELASALNCKATFR